MSRLRILLAAVEPSADEIGASLMRDLRKLAPEAEFFGCGGPAMEGEGLSSLFPIEPFSVMGVTDAVRVYPAALKRSRELADLAAAQNIDVAVLIDAWAFSRLVAIALRKFSPSTSVIKLVAPQVWASRPKRVNFVKRYFDGVLALFPFEPPFFERAGVAAEFIGNPNFQRAWTMRGDGERFRARNRLGDAPVIAVLPGSRKREVTRLARPFCEAVELLAKEIPDLRVLVPAAPSVAGLVERVIASWPGAPIIVGPDEKYDAMAAANVALTASGTASTELAINRTPMVVAYSVDPITAFWARRIVTTPYASVINVAADRLVIPEFIQENCEGRLIASGLLELFENPSAFVEQAEAFDIILKELGVDGPSASAIAARRVIEWAGKGKKRVRESRLLSSGPAS